MHPILKALTSSQKSCVTLTNRRMNQLPFFKRQLTYITILLFHSKQKRHIICIRYFTIFLNSKGGGIHLKLLLSIQRISKTEGHVLCVYMRKSLKICSFPLAKPSKMYIAFQNRKVYYVANIDTSSHCILTLIGARSLL